MRQPAHCEDKKNRQRPRVSLWCVALACAFGLMSGGVARAQSQSLQVGRAAGRIESGRSVDELVKRAMGVACAERELDPQGSAPIDEMQARPSLPVRHAEVV
ncbi:MAG: hypothetical protein QOD28_29, partial [Acidobacteriota bacterium]|nr:hypothetical protein [Acidobacteriota bacterium]